MCVWLLAGFTSFNHSDGIPRAVTFHELWLAAWLPTTHSRWLMQQASQGACIDRSLNRSNIIFICAIRYRGETDCLSCTCWWREHTHLGCLTLISPGAHLRVCGQDRERGRFLCGFCFSAPTKEDVAEKQRSWSAEKLANSELGAGGGKKTFYYYFVLVWALSPPANVAKTIWFSSRSNATSYY